MMVLSQVAAAGGGGGAAILSSTHRCSLKFAHPNPPLFSKRRRNNANFSPLSSRKPLKPLNATEPSTSAKESSNSISFVGQEEVPLEGVIQFEKTSSNSLIAKWSRVALLAGGDVAALLLFSAIGRFSHGFSIFDIETFKTADPFIAGWFLSAYFLGGYGEEGRGLNGRWKAVIAAAKSWSAGIPLGLIIRTLTIGHTPPTNFILVTMGSTAVLLIGWRALLFTLFPASNGKKSDVYKRGSPFELFEASAYIVGEKMVIQKQLVERYYDLVLYEENIVIGIFPSAATLCKFGFVIAKSVE